ncbi:MAG: TraR/DksA C4-type zinc finger protein [Deltaproteobacteria bacterium]|jgi:formylmethanofuran dehydrogenase subunit E|nr:TraR/DksA C4-type zinc finger protein [Deltaproteobacteria bacterium]
MKQKPISQELIKATIDFHGHSCPGLAIGIRAAEMAMDRFGRSPDEEIVAVVETDMCAVDAIQFLLGCTFGKGNLIHLDYGKSAFTFHSRQDGKSIRIVAKQNAIGVPGDELIALRTKKLKEELTSDEQKRLKEATAERTKRIMEADIDKLFEVKPTLSPVPRKARILESLICRECGEATMESRTRRLFGKTLCTSCFEALEKRL